MFQKRFVCLMTVLACLFGLAGTAFALEVDCDAVYCFTQEDFSQEEQVTGICITGLPESQVGTVMLGTRVLREGDILAADQLPLMTFCPVRTEEDVDAIVTYLPIYENRVEKATTMTIAVRGKEDMPPIAEDFAVETYKNLPNEAKLKAKDPEGQALTYTIVRQPRRGEVTVAQDGTFVYTPKKNKVGVDSFIYTATDPAGNVSREAMVTVQILKPADASQYTDTVGKSCRFEAEWLRNTGLFEGEKLSGQNCFYPDKAVTKGEFLAMMMKLLEIPMEEQVAYTGMAQEAPDWLKPYLAAAVRSGLMSRLPDSETGSFAQQDAITGGEAAVMLQNALDLAEGKVEAVAQEEVPAWAEDALQTMNSNGFVLDAGEAMTRAQVAELLYQISCIAPNAPGMMVFRMQQ